MSLSADSLFRPLFHIPWDMICFLLWCYISMCPVCEAASLWSWAPVLSVCIVFLESCSLQRAFVCQALSAAEMFGVNPSYTTAPFPSWCCWTWAPKSMRKGQLDCDGPHFKRPKEWEEEGRRAIDYICGFFLHVYTDIHTIQRAWWTSVTTVLFPCLSWERKRLETSAGNYNSCCSPSLLKLFDSFVWGVDWNLGCVSKILLFTFPMHSNLAHWTIFFPLHFKVPFFLIYI